MTDVDLPLRVRAKICGLTRVEDVQAVVTAGADAIGLVLHPSSPRAVTLTQAVELIQHLPPFITVTGLFVDPQPEWVEQVLAAVPLDLLQFHGDEAEGFCSRFGRPYIKALRMRPGFEPQQVVAAWPTARGFLLDAYRPGVPGGTGATFDWQRFPKSRDHAWILAGGLTPGNVSQALQATQAYAVDVSGGVEQGRGIKCPAKIRAFMKAVRSQGV